MEDKPILEAVKCSDYSKRILNLYNSGLQPGDSTQWPGMDPFYTVQPGQWTLVTGVPSHGKSTWVDCLTVNLSTIGWRFVVHSPEQEPIETHMSLLAEKVQRRPFRKGFHNCMGKPELAAAIKFIDEHYTFLRAPSESMMIPSLMDLMESAGDIFGEWRKDGFQGNCGLIIDPWNELNHDMMADAAETKYICEMLSMLRRYTRNFGIHTWLVAHPMKLSKNKDGEYPVPRPYDISGSAHWYNKADNCITVFRPDEGEEVEIHIQKVRFRHIGKKGVVPLTFDVSTGTYIDYTPKTRNIRCGATMVSKSTGDDY